MRMKLLVTGLDFLIPWCGDYIKSAEAVYTSDCSEENLSRMVADCDAILYMQAKSYPITRKIIDSAKKLRFIQSAGVGYEKIDLVAAMENGVVVMNMPTGTTVSVAEHAIALILACAKNLLKGHQNIREGGWRVWDFGLELDGKTLGIVGFGKIGQETAKRMKAFNMQLLVYDPLIHDDQIAHSGWKKADLPTLLKESDIVTLHCPLTKETRGLIGAKELAVMKQSSILVNTARGEVVDEKALIEALKSGKLKCAGLDTFAIEPIESDSPLLRLENVILTPHMAVQTTDAIMRFMQANGEQVENALNGTYANVVNPEVLGKLACS